MSRKEIEQKVREIVALQFDIIMDELELETTFVEDLNSDSLDTVEIIMCVEDRFNITVRNEDAEKLSNVGMVVDYLENRFANESSE